MKIVIFDCNGGKFTNVLREHWKSQGHTVEFTLYWDPRMCQDADVVFFDWADNSVQRASNDKDVFYKKLDTSMPTGKVILRAHDIDVWTGGLRNIQPDFVDETIFVADHIYRKAKSQQMLPLGSNVEVIKHGIDTSKFTFGEHSGKKIAWIGRYDYNKDARLALLLLADLPRDYSLHLLGLAHKPAWEEAYFQNFIKLNNLDVTFTERVEHVNDWLEDKDYLLSCSKKEAFSYAVGEAMAKGIKPVIHRFYGAEEVWDEKYIWDTPSQAVKMLKEVPNSQEYRNYIEKTYPLNKMLEAYDKVINN